MRLARLLLLAAATASPLAAQLPLTRTPQRPFGTLREQAALQQQWLQERMTTVLPALMRKHKVAMWVMPIREYNEDPVFTSITSATTFAARRRTIYVAFDPCSRAGAPATCTDKLELIALGGSSQGGVWTAVRSTKSVKAAVGGQQAELWGDEQWNALKAEITKRNPKNIAVNVSRTWAFADGLSAGEYEGMREALGPALVKRIVRAEALAVDFIATRLPAEEQFYRELQALVHALTQRMFSNEVITPGVTTVADVLWWWRQAVNDLGLGTWFQANVSVQRQGVSSDQLGESTVIQKGDVLWCDVGITALRLNTDTQHNGYVLKDGETDAPAGLRAALKRSNRLQDILFEETRPGRTGNEVLKAVRAKMTAEGLDGTMYSHPIGMHGHGAGPLIGLWDYQDGVPGRGDHPVLANMWFSSELQVTTPVPEWGGQPVRIAQEEDFVVGADGTPRWALRRQDRFWLVAPKP
ncbi:MAG: M24 family metallopeptidase [Gemmatimonadaceae bacterium]|nr:M24 family metallopeptidase [Gemmatimonadaceae bacterium]